MPNNRSPEALQQQAEEVIRQYGYPEQRPGGDVGRAAYAPIYDESGRPLERFILRETLPSGELRLLTEDPATGEAKTLWVFGATNVDDWSNVETAAGLRHIVNANEALEARNGQMASRRRPPEVFHH